MDYAGCARLEHLKVIRAAIYHSLRILLAKDEKDFPWDEDLIQAAEAMCRKFLASKVLQFRRLRQPDGKQEKTEETMMNEKHERFIRIVERRMDVLTNDFEVGKLRFKVSYDYTEEEVTCIVEELERQVALLRERFAGKEELLLFPWMPIHPEQ